MRSAIATLLLLYGPVVLAVLGVFLILRPPAGNREFEFYFSPVPSIHFPIRIRSRTLWRLAWLVAAASFAAFLIFRDYSSFFPTHLEMDVFYDRDGLAESVDAIGTSAVARLQLRTAIATEAQKYYEELDSRVRKVVGIDSFEGFTRHAVHSTGRTTFRIRKAGAWQTYYIEEASGDVTHVAEPPGLPRATFVSYFEKLATKDDYVKAKVGDVLRGRAILLHPRFKHSFAENRTSTRETFEVSVVGVTAVRVFPWPEVSNTVYFADVSSLGLVPFAYAIYRN